MAQILLLLVEDEPMLAESLEMFLSAQGFEVHVAPSGTQALDEIQSPEVYDAIITDIRLGEGPEGWEVARKAREENPCAMVVYMSGYTTPNQDQQKVPRSTMLQKPFRPEELARVLAPLLSGQ